MNVLFFSTLVGKISFQLKLRRREHNDLTISSTIDSTEKRPYTLNYLNGRDTFSRVYINMSKCAGDV